MTCPAAVDWRIFSQSHALTDKQQKTAEKIRQRERTIHNLQTETDRIRVRCCCHAGCLEPFPVNLLPAPAAPAE